MFEQEKLHKRRPWGQATEEVLGLLVNAGSQHRPEEVRGPESLQVIP